MEALECGAAARSWCVVLLFVCVIYVVFVMDPVVVSFFGHLVVIGVVIL